MKNIGAQEAGLRPPEEALYPTVRKLRKGISRPPPNEEYFLMAFSGFLVVGLCFLGRVVKTFREPI